MSRIVAPRRDLILPSRFRQRQGGYVVLDPYRFGGGSGVAYTTLNPADKSSNVALSGGNLVAGALALGAGFARSVQPIAGPSYFEGVFTASTGTGASQAIGIAQSTATNTGSLGFSTSDAWAIWGPSYGAHSAGVTAYPERLMPDYEGVLVLADLGPA